MSEIEKMLEHVLNCFSTQGGIQRCNDTQPLNGQISVGTFSKARTLLKDAKEVREVAIMGRELADEVERLIALHLMAVGLPNAGSGTPGNQITDQIEISKRRLADAFREMDVRKGLYVDPHK